MKHNQNFILLSRSQVENTRVIYLSKLLIDNIKLSIKSIVQLSNYWYLSSYGFILLLYRHASMDERNEIKKKLKTTKRW